MAASSLFQTLQQGVLIENRKIMLPWGTDMAELVRHCKPDHIETGPVISELFWSGPVVLAGLSGAALEAQVGPELPLTQVWVWLERGYSDHSAESKFRSTYRHLQRLFGSPIPKIKDIDEGELEYEKIFRWKQNGVEISLMLKLGPEFGDYSYGCLVMIEKRA